jgi:hypothetical protein
MRQVKTHKINRVRYDVDSEEIDGVCVLPNSRPTLHIACGLACGNKKYAKKGLVTLLEEILHAELPYKRQKTIGRMANEMGNVIWGQGYRRKE